MEPTKLEISLKQYLDEKFGEVKHKLDVLEILRQEEHDVVVSMARDVAFRSEEIIDIKKNIREYKSECMNRKTDFDERVIKVVTPIIDSTVYSATSKLWITIVTAAVVFLAGFASYVVDKFVTSRIVDDKVSYSGKR